MQDNDFSLADFPGRARLFPLPNLVLFPHVAQPLHIFEPRYRQMMADALDDDRLMAIVLLRPGWEEDYHKTPPIHQTACLGRVLQEERLPDGRYNLLLHGLCRVRIKEELAPDKLYRAAEVEVLQDMGVESEMEAQVLREELAMGVTPFFASNAKALEQLERLVNSDLPLGVLSDIFSFALPLESEIKQELLDEIRVGVRVRRLLRSLEGKTPPVRRRQFPPEFSIN